MSGRNFTGKKNYLKQSSFSDSSRIAAPSVLNGATFLYQTTLTITHNLGYVPMVRVYYDPYDNGRIYPATGSRVSGAGPGLAYGDTMCLWEVSETALTITLEAVNSQAGNRTVYWRIYRDQA